MNPRDDRSCRSFQPSKTHVASDTTASECGPSDDSTEPLTLGGGQLSNDHEEDVMPKLTRGQLVGIGTLGFAVEFCWTAGEALIIPYLVDCGMAVEIAGLVWLGTPLVAILLQPMLGAWSDRCTWSLGRRRPFVVGLSAFSVACVLLVVFASDWFEERDTAVPWLTFAAYSGADLGYICLLAFGRALLGDLCPPEQLHTGHATFSFLQMSGRIVVLMMGLIDLSTMFPFFATHAQTRALLLLTALVLAACCAIGCFSANERPFFPGEMAGSQNDINETTKLLTGAKKPLDCARTPTTGLDDSEGQPNQGTPGEPWGGLPREMWVLLGLSMIGWIAIMMQGFFWTEWIGLETTLPGTGLSLAFFTLLLFAVASAVTVTAMPILNMLGPFVVLLGGELLFMAAMIATPYARHLGVAVGVMVASGMAYAVHSNNTFLVCDMLAQHAAAENCGGYYTSLVNSTLTVGQIVVGALGGLLIKAVDGRIDFAFCLVGLAGAVLILGSIGLAVCVQCSQSRQSTSGIVTQCAMSS